MNTHEFKAALWVAFWLFVLTVGDPDIIDASIDLIQVVIKILETRYA